MYLPSLWSRLVELFIAFVRVIDPPSLPPDWHRGSVLVVLDPIEAYDTLFARPTRRRICSLIREARENDVPVVVTRWDRYRPTTHDKMDAIDRKGHWSFYIARGTTYLLRSISSALRSDANSTSSSEYNVQVVPVKHTNAFANSSFVEAFERLEGVDRVILAGSWTESCVINTARAALDRDKDVMVVKSACAGHQPTSFLSLITMQVHYGQVYK